MIIKCLVAGQGCDGPELIPIKVSCSQDEYDNGQHYEAAKDYVDLDDIHWVCDENDPASDVFDSFYWNNAPLINVKGLPIQ